MVALVRVLLPGTRRARETDEIAVPAERVSQSGDLPRLVAAALDQ